MAQLDVLKTIIPSYLLQSTENPDGLTDERLQHYLNMAEESIQNKRYPFGIPIDPLSALPISLEARFQTLQLELAKYLVNREGTEGETYHGENGINRAYESGIIPASMLRNVTPRARVLG